MLHKQGRMPCTLNFLQEPFWLHPLLYEAFQGEPVKQGALPCLVLDTALIYWCKKALLTERTGMGLLLQSVMLPTHP